MKSRKIAVLVLSLAMVLTMGASVFADGKAAATENQQAAADAAKLVKYLKKGEGVNNPNAKFTFTFTPQEQTTTTLEGGKSNTSAAREDYPNASANDGVFTYEINASDVTTDAEIAGTGDVKKSVTIAKIFEGKTFASAGEYIYKVKESGTLTEDTDAETEETLTNDTQEYTLRLYVKNSGDSTAIDKVTVENKDGDKVDPTDEDVTPGSGETYGPDYSADGFTFTNKYDVKVKDVPGEDHTNPTNPTYAGFGVTKKVDGNYASKTQDFTFKVTIDKPANAPADAKTGKYKKIGDASETEFTYGEPFTVTLKHNQNFGITDMYLGSHVTVTESAAQYYTPSVKGLFTVNENRSNVACGNDDPIAIGTRNKGSIAAFTNTMKPEDEPTPTGIIINNLPYVLLIAIALGGIILFSRKRRYE